MPTVRVAGKGTSALPRLQAHTYYAPQNGALTPIDSSFMSYASAQSQSPATQTIYRFTSGQWKLYSRYDYTYDNRGNNVVTEYSIWSSSSNSYSKVVRYNYSYNTADAKTALFYEIWNAQTASYGNGLKEVYTLNGRNNVVDYMQEIWNTPKSAWQNSEHYTYTYTPQELVEESVYQYWDATATPVAMWRNKTRHFYTYDASGKNRVADTTYSWGSMSSSWGYSKLSTNALNQAGLPGTTTDMNYNSTTFLWYPSAQHYFTFNASGGMLTTLHTQWDATSGTYINTFNTSQAYNSDGQPTILNTESWTGSAWAVGIGSERSRNYYEGDLQLSVPVASSQLALAAGPLPATDILHISIAGNAGNASPATAALVNLQGQAVANCTLVTEATIPVSLLPAGTYILTVRDHTGATATRVVPVVH